MRAFALTAIIPTKNRPAQLARALRSVLRQRFDDYETIVVDDGEGAAKTIAEHFAGRADLICLDNRGRGQVAARNLGLGAARGDIVAFLDDDDAWGREDYLMRIARALAATRGASFASGEIVVQDDALNVVERLPFRAANDAASLLRDNKILVSGFAFWREHWRALGGFDESLPHYWDWDWYIRLARAGVIFADLGDMAIEIFASATSVSAEANREARQAELDRLAAKHGLADLRLRNHESIARDEAGAAGR